MIAESSLQIAAQQPLIADRLPPVTTDRQQSTARHDLYLRLGVPLAVSVESCEDGIRVRGDLEKMNWAVYEVISRGLRKLIATRLSIDPELLALNKLLVVDSGHATQYFEILVPPSHGATFASANTQADITTFLRVVKGERLPEDEPIAQEKTPGQTADAAVPVGSAPFGTTNGASPADLAREVRAAIGGKTLPAACTIDSPSWSTSMSISGKLGERLRNPPSEPQVLEIDCHVDGYLKSQRLVHLLPVLLSSDAGGTKRDGRKVVAFDEEKWLDRIASLASKHGQLVKATYQCVVDDRRELLQLLDIASIAETQKSHG